MYATSLGYKILLIEDNPGDSELIEEMLMELDGIPFHVLKAASVLEGLKFLAQPERPDLILLDLYLPDSQGLATFQTIHTHSPSVPVVVLTGVQSDSIGVEAVSQGAQDFLVKTGLTSELLVRSLRYAIARGRRTTSSGPVALNLSKVIGFLGVKGGVGTTSLTCHFSTQLKNRTEAPVLTADLDLEGGALSFLLQAQSTFSIADAIENLHHLDAEYWKKVISTGLGGIHVLNSPASAGRYQKPSAEVAACVLRFARTLYPWIIVDLGRSSEFAANVAAEMDEILLVSTPEIVSLQAARKVHESLRESGLTSDRLHLLQNRTLRLPEGSNMIEEIVGLPVYNTIPESPRDLGEAYLRGTLAAPSSAFGSAVHTLVNQITGLKDSSPPSWVANLRHLFSQDKSPKVGV